jgi:putative peptidoglycan lipid II flippase
MAFLAYVLVDFLLLGFTSRPYWQGSLRGRTSPWKNNLVWQMVRMSGPLLLSFSAVYINQQVNKILVSGLTAGTVTAMGYAAVLSQLVSTFSGSFCSILFPYIATHIGRGEDPQAASLTTRSAGIMLLAFWPITILTILCAQDIVTIVFGRGAFGAEGLQMATVALQGYAVMFVPIVLQDLYSRFQYGYQNSAAPTVNSTIGIATNIVLSIALCPRHGIFGVALASSISTAISGVLNAITARKCNPHLKLMPLVRQLPWMFAGGLACAGTVMWTLRSVVLDSSLLRFVLATAVGGIAYLLVVSPVLLRLLRDHNF